MSRVDSLTALVNHGGQLKTQALAKRRGGLHVDIMAAQRRLYNFTLRGSWEINGKSVRADKAK